jgi:hypothetical protein
VAQKLTATELFAGGGGTPLPYVFNRESSHAKLYHVKFQISPNHQHLQHHNATKVNTEAVGYAAPTHLSNIVGDKKKAESAKKAALKEDPYLDHLS